MAVPRRNTGGAASSAVQADELRDGLATPPQDWPEEAFGRSARLSTGEFALFAMRVVLGLSMLQVAFNLARGGWDAWMNAGALLPAVVKGPMGDVYTALWGNETVMFLIIAGAAAVGIGMVTGFLTRVSALVGTVMMFSFYTADMPPTNGWFEVQLIQMFAFFLVASLGAGHIWGIDALLRKREKSRWWYWMLG